MRHDRRNVVFAASSWHRSDLPKGIFAPSVVLPIVVRGDVLGIVVYGFHRNGTTLLTEEIDVLAHLVDAASVAANHLAVIESDRRIAELEGRLARFERSAIGT